MSKNKIQKSKIRIVKNCSFYGHILLHMNIKEDNKIDTLGVDKRGNLYYNGDFVKKLTDDELYGCLIHEIMHMALMTFPRKGGREHIKWNIASDIMINNLLVNERIKLPKEGIIPNNNKIVLDGFVINELDKKIAEEVYDLIPDSVSEGIKNFDEHLKVEGDDLFDEKEERKWKNIVSDAITISKIRGDLPGNLQKLFDDLHNPKVNWKQKLRKYIKNEIPFDYTYRKPHKKSIATGFYMPTYLKEKIDICVAIDTSGSISKEDYTKFMSEIIGISNEFKDKIDMRILTHDCEVSDDYLIKNANKEKIFKLEIHGGGGTSHKPIFKHIKDKYPTTKLVIFFTDAFSDLEEINFNEYKFNKLFILNSAGHDNFSKSGCEVIRL